MKLAISNIAWDAVWDKKVYSELQKLGICGLEIAPTRVFPEAPYQKLNEARDWSNQLYEMYGLKIASMQSIWYGRSEQLFGTDQDRYMLLEYTKKAIDFAEKVQCRNLVFGSPKNRVVMQGMEPERKEEIERNFFEELGNYAKNSNTVIAMEANPVIYQTNYINRTQEAVDLAQRLSHPGIGVNLDVGTMIVNNESVDELYGCLQWVNHVHISEPRLALIQKRELHGNLMKLLREASYQGYVSVEMGKRDDMQEIQEVLKYVKGL